MKFQRKDGPSPVSRPRPAQSDETIAAVAPDASWHEPWVQMKYFTYAPAVYPRMLAATSPNIKPGGLVTVYDRNGSRFGAGDAVSFYWSWPDALAEGQRFVLYLVSGDERQLGGAVQAACQHSIDSFRRINSHGGGDLYGQF